MEVPLRDFISDILFIKKKIYFIGVRGLEAMQNYLRAIGRAIIDYVDHHGKIDVLVKNALQRLCDVRLVIVCDHHDVHEGRFHSQSRFPRLRSADLFAG